MHNEDSADESTMVRPNITINRHHMEIIDDFVGDRHASQSEAVRAAIDHYDQATDEEHETIAEQLNDQFDTLRGRLDAIEAQLDELKNSSPRRRQAQPPQRSRQPAPQMADAVADNDPDAGRDIRDSVLKVVLDDGPVSAVTITEQIGEGLTDVQSALQQLVEDGHISVLQNGDTVEYTSPSPADASF